MKKFFLYVSFALILLGIPVSVFLVGRNQELRKRASPATTLFISPASLTKNVGDTFSLDVKIDTAANQVGVVQIKLEYDPTKLEALDITNGALAPTIRVSGKIDASGFATITVGAKSTAEPITESGTIAVVTMKAIAATTEPVNILFSAPPETYANALSEGSDNVLIGMTPASLIILPADGASNPSPTPTPTLILLASPTATPSMGLTPSPTPLTENNQASASALTITSIQPNENISTNQPMFTGTAPPGYTVTLTIHSDSQTGIAQIDQNGYWTYTPAETLDDGPHTIVALATNPATGETETVTIPFVVNSGNSASESAMPISGDITSTLLLLGLSFLLLAAGGLMPFMLRTSYD